MRFKCLESAILFHKRENLYQWKCGTTRLRKQGAAYHNLLSHIGTELKSWEAEMSENSQSLHGFFVRRNKSLLLVGQDYLFWTSI